METVSGVSNWKLVIRREERSVCILRAVTCDERAVLPEELFGLPVTELGGHALSPTAPAGAEGEEVLVSCGLTDEEARWDNRRLTDLTLPAVLQKVGDYALLNCSGLKPLRLHDGVTFWGGGALMNCRSLDTFFLARVGEQQESLSFFADELSRELDVTIYETDGQTVHLIFPEFVEAYEENCPAHHFDYNIYGAGYPYHHCFRQKKLSLREYDTLWKGFLGMEHDEESGVRLAWWRLRCPAELTERAARRYWDHLEHHADTLLRWLVSRRDAAGIAFFLGQVTPEEGALAQACEAAREERASECLAVLLEQRHRKGSAGAEKRFDL